MEQSNTVVNKQESTTQADNEVVENNAGKGEVIEGNKPAPENQAGSKTDPNLLLKSLKEEREKRRELEKEIETLKSSALPEEEVYSEEGKALQKHISTLTDELSQLKKDRELEKVFAQFPDVKEVGAEFEQFASDYPKHKLENVAKLFRAEKGLLEPARKGLEKGTGGTKTPSSSGMTADDVRVLRKTNFKKYQGMVLKGQLRID